MSLSLLKLAKEFTKGNLSPEEFVDKFAILWQEERDSEVTLLDDDDLSQKLSTIFCFADLYNPSDNREEYEYDDCRLRSEIGNLIGGA
jgi:hypothetical protein